MSECLTSRPGGTPGEIPAAEAHPPSGQVLRENRCRLRPDVVLHQQDGQARLLDFARGRFYALDEPGNRLLSLALAAGPTEAVRRVAAEYGVETDRVRKDWDTLLRALRRNRLVTAEAAPHRPGRPPGRLTVALLLAVAWFSLRLLGWAGAIRLWRRWGRRRARPHTAPEGETVRAVDHAVRGAAARHPLNARCKERALVCWHLLRAHAGLPARLVVGVELYPFRAHAWVECDHWVLTDDPGSCEVFTPVACYA
jgi:hypothetical protein